MNLLAAIPWYYRVAAIAALVAAASIVSWFKGDAHGEASKQADWDKAKAAQVQAREQNRGRAATASSDFQADQAAIRNQATLPPSPEVRNALQRPICPLAAASAPLSLPALQLAQPLRLEDVPVPAALVDELRRAGADPGAR